MIAKKTFLFVCSFILFFTASCSAKSDTANRNDCTVWFLKVGKADSILVSSGDNAVLIDSGLNESSYEIVAALHSEGIKKLDGVFLTHTHKDHIGGLENILANFTVDKVYRSEISEHSPKGKNKIDSISETAGVKTTLLKAGDAVVISDDLRFDVIGPLEFDSEDDNDNSLVMVLNSFGIKTLLTGDMQFKEEFSLMKQDAEVRADILKIGNHGNPDATSEEFLERVSPEIAVFTTDRKVDSDTANERIVSALNRMGCNYYITDETEMGVRIRIGRDGIIDTEIPARPKSNVSGIDAFADKEEGILILLNNSESEIDMSGFTLCSEKGGKMVVFPQDTFLSRGESLTVSGKKGEGKIKVENIKKFWTGNKKNAVYLRDAYGNVICVL